MFLSEVRVFSFLKIIPLMVHIHLSIHSLGIVPGENLTLPKKEQDYGSLWHSTDSLHNDKLPDWYTSPIVIWVKKIKQE
jgi:hypothetical protein